VGVVVRVRHALPLNLGVRGLLVRLLIRAVPTEPKDESFNLACFQRAERNAEVERLFVSYIQEPNHGLSADHLLSLVCEPSRHMLRVRRADICGSEVVHAVRPFRQKANLRRCDFCLATCLTVSHLGGEATLLNIELCLSRLSFLGDLGETVSSFNAPRVVGEAQRPKADRRTNRAEDYPSIHGESLETGRPRTLLPRSKRSRFPSLAVGSLARSLSLPGLGWHLTAPSWHCAQVPCVQVLRPVREGESEGSD
jgi:hypothetical protein